MAGNPAMISYVILIVDREKQVQLWSAMKYWLWTVKSGQHCLKPGYDQLWSTDYGPRKADNIAWNLAMISYEILIVDREKRTTLLATRLWSAMKYWLWTVKSGQHCLKPGYDQVWNTAYGPWKADNIAWNPAMIRYEILIMDHEKRTTLLETRLWSGMKYWLWTVKSKQHCLKPGYDQLWNTDYGPWKADNIAWNPAMIRYKILIMDHEKPDNIAWNPAMIRYEILIMDHEKRTTLLETRLWSGMKYWLWTMKRRQHCLKPSYDQVWNTDYGLWKADNIAWNPAMIRYEILIMDHEKRTTLIETWLWSGVKYWLWTMKSGQHCMKPSYYQPWNIDCGLWKADNIAWIPAMKYCLWIVKRVQHCMKPSYDQPLNIYCGP